MAEGLKRVIGIMAAILTAMHMRTADDLFGTPARQPSNRQVDCRFNSVGRENHAEN